ncbi:MULTISPECIES: HTH-type transcriptional activator IlvY [unclassified Francisella]|uniref:HTH-type transcriptional activator IlvY n=1 Tax=unclassified Francisella TaxID=2610885 RepID=UPI002E30311D|nr:MULTISPECIES: HTH-type transcriptional activator IlvY [unclassified Francisella]MED7820398.1 HTH-type transcriptional activator IlvY [Francisella sp. 19S2-4]MED7831233.1 HTH-type transcriptional activator IlvY [Francisella sp. 19S2-10]
MIDKKELNAFKILAETLHFGRASEKCFLTPSALTRLIQRIEQEIGAVLFERDSRNIRLTDAGKVYYQFAKEMLQKYEDLNCILHPKKGQIMGDIRLSCTVTASYVVLPNIIKKLHIDYPGIKIQLTTGSIKNCTSQLEEDTTDVIIGILSKDIPINYCVKEVLTTKMVMIAPSTRKVKSLKQAAKDIPFIRPSHYIGSSNLDEWFMKQNLKPEIYGDVDGNEAILSLVSSGIGTSIVPEVILKHSHLSKSVNIIKTQGLPDISVGVVMRKESLISPVKKIFWELCETLDVIEI